jgi:hypothetical protein
MNTSQEEQNATLLKTQEPIFVNVHEQEDTITKQSDLAEERLRESSHMRLERNSGYDITDSTKSLTEREPLPQTVPPVAAKKGWSLFGAKNKTKQEASVQKEQSGFGSATAVGTGKHIKSSSGTKEVFGLVDGSGIYETHSDQARLGHKKLLSELADSEMMEGVDAEYKAILDMVKVYAGMNKTITSSVYEESARKEEGKYLSEIIAKIKDYAGAPETKERHTKGVFMLQNILNMPTNGYLEVPKDVDISKVVTVGFDNFRVCKKSKGETVYVTENNKRVKKHFKKGEKIPLDIVEKDKREELLFPHEPSVMDIVQGAVGDCYLLAALASLVNVNPQYIKSCMKDNGNGTVTVRFHKKIKKEPLNRNT